MMANRNATKEEKQLLKDMRQLIDECGLGVLYKGYEGRTDYDIHHVLGRSAKNNKVHIGYNFIIPVPTELHDNGDHPLNVTHHKHAFTGEHGKQWEIHIKMINLLVEHGYDTPNSIILEAIMGTGA